MKTKKHLIGFMGALLLLVGCTPKIPEGKIKDFVEKIEYNETFSNVHVGESVVQAKHFQDGIEVGSITITTQIDKTSRLNYYYQKTEVSGNYFGTNEDQYQFYKEEILFRLDSENNIVAQRVGDGKSQEITASYELFNSYVTEFFYLELEGGYHRGGQYYGDYVLANCGKYYDQFSLNEEETELTYAINVASVDIDNKEIITMHKFSIDKYGMLLNLSSNTFYSENDGNRVETTIECDYSGSFEKVYNL